MSDFLNIRVTQRELDLIMDLLHEAGGRTDADGQPAIEICHDLMEQSGGAVDEWEPANLQTLREPDLKLLNNETRIFSASLVMEELARAPVSKAEERRRDRFGEFEVVGTASMAVHRKHKRKAKRCREQANERQTTETQRVDVWERPNDPTKW
tara:strand:- start:168 stop:626 length:459 start_codon:yes stop_codon:yes gene_type:complete